MSARGLLQASHSDTAVANMLTGGVGILMAGKWEEKTKEEKLAELQNMMLGVADYVAGEGLEDEDPDAPPQLSDGDNCARGAKGLNCFHSRSVMLPKAGRSGSQYHSDIEPRIALARKKLLPTNLDAEDTNVFSRGSVAQNGQKEIGFLDALMPEEWLSLERLAQRPLSNSFDENADAGGRQQMRKVRSSGGTDDNMEMPPLPVILASPRRRQHFFEWLENTHTPEYPALFDDLDTFKRAQTPEHQLSLASQIFNRFFRNGADLEITLNFEVMEPLMAMLNEGRASSTMFSAVENEVLRIIAGSLLFNYYQHCAFNPPPL
mmetsp:Transcript_44775/g.112877  ORF Transcript_44775/g.112877 Transcript_44775/m.112877 type:complete len:320 (-) Transcript_44775:95-1054(-)|eukprot:CAMPEP_0177635234 /NCGR_PEP_ID=MMETSP0447-20121125/3794_1 /TAXON_ID=0 /ORGANISM="Stygamoeba regulata, Strain BSH-02190019" /LENGTH=319 /DNA_ID=CAMNT_0019137011 /DNA_START=228 /DNA_END=1187 /DNA_ORIENTATION=+